MCIIENCYYNRKSLHEGTSTITFLSILASIGQWKCMYELPQLPCCLPTLHTWHTLTQVNEEKKRKEIRKKNINCTFVQLRKKWEVHYATRNSINHFQNLTSLQSFQPKDNKTYKIHYITSFDITSFFLKQLFLSLFCLFPLAVLFIV